MICLPISIFWSGLDWNVERQTCSLLRSHAKDRHASGQACVFATHGVLAAEHVWPLRDRSSGRTQGAGLLVPGPVFRHGEVNLRAQAKRLYHMGFRCQTISRNTLANANATRPWQIYAHFAEHLIGMARPLYVNEPLGVDLDATVYAFDATTIDLCLSVYPWAPFRRAKAAIKLHTLLDLRGSIPSFIRITDGKTHEVNVPDDLVIEPGAF
jgi:hypothetical protein